MARRHSPPRGRRIAADLRPGAARSAAQRAPDGSRAADAGDPSSWAAVGVVITDALLNAAMAVWDFVMGLLPSGHLDMPDPGGVADVLGGVDSLVPILGPLAVAMTILGALVTFLIVRVILVVINIIWP
jgi:hypothetical protein